jgi:hypothetical protein
LRLALISLDRLEFWLLPSSPGPPVAGRWLTSLRYRHRPDGLMITGTPAQNSHAPIRTPDSSSSEGWERISSRGSSPEDGVFVDRPLDPTADDTTRLLFSAQCQPTPITAPHSYHLRLPAPSAARRPALTTPLLPSHRAEEAPMDRTPAKLVLNDGCVRLSLCDVWQLLCAVAALRRC